MQYKVRYRPLERLGRDGWKRLSDAEQDRLVTAVASQRRADMPVPDGGGKDGMGSLDPTALSAAGIGVSSLPG